MKILILYLDDDLVVVDKPAGMPTHAPDPADPYPGDALRVVQRQTGLAALGMHQRLDAGTSGVLLFSARPEANRALAAAFERREVHKVYRAWVRGAPRRAEGTIDAPIVRDRDGRYRVAAPGDPRGQAARTRYRVLHVAREPAGAQISAGRDAGPDATLALVEIAPETGRSHQIRVHLAHIGHPVVGDPLYGPAARASRWPLPDLPRLCLHAAELTLAHPATGRPAAFRAPPPWLFDAGAADALRAALAAAGLHVREAFERAPDGVRTLLELACDRRSPLAADPETSIYRLFNGAGDGLRGLAVDRCGDVVVAGLYDDAPVANAPAGSSASGGSGEPEPDASLRPVPAGLIDLLIEATGARTLYAKHRPRQASHIADEQLALLAPPAPLAGPEAGELVAHEDGLAYVIRPAAGLSVGLYPDMREGRGRVRAWAAGRRVLNCFAYTCGFGVAATAGGATRVLNLDVSRPALAWGQENYRANGFEPDAHDFVYGDVFDWLARLARRDERFDLVILDPPGYSRTRARRFSAARDYGELVALAMGVMAPDGMLLACCNVAELPWRAFRERVLAGIARAGRAAEVVGVHHEPGIDHPTAPGAAPYLKMLAVRAR